MNVLVTGGAGYLGSIVAFELMQAGHGVTIYDNLSHGAREAGPPGATLVVGELADHQALSSVFNSAKPEAVMHFAALIEAGESMKFPERYFRNNTATTLTLLETMLEHGVKRFVFSSTAALYGDPLRIQWELRPDVADNPGTGGDWEPSVEPISDSVVATSDNGRRASQPA